MKYNNSRVLETLGRRESQSRAERVAISSGKAKVVSDASKPSHQPDHHHLDPDPSTIPAIVRWTTPASFAHGVFMLQAMRVTTLASP